MSYNVIALEPLLDVRTALINLIINDNTGGVRFTTGLCWNIGYSMKQYDYDVRSVVEDFILDGIRSWRYYSGNNSYPVPSGIEHVNARDAYNSALHSDTLYVGEYGLMRKRLALHLIHRIGRYIADRVPSRCFAPYIVNRLEQVIKDPSTTDGLGVCSVVKLAVQDIVCPDFEFVSPDDDCQDLLDDYRVYRCLASVKRVRVICDRLTSKVALTWQHFSGHMCFPVPSPDANISHNEMYGLNVGDWRAMYQGIYGSARLNFIAHIINVAESYLSSVNERWAIVDTRTTDTTDIVCTFATRELARRGLKTINPNTIGGTGKKMFKILDLGVTRVNEWSSV